MADKTTLAIDLQKEIERQRNQSFLQNSTELRAKQDEENARSVEILNDYSRRQQLADNIQGLIPTPRPKMPTKQFNPASLAVVPAALKFLRKRAVKNEQTFNPPKEIPQLKRRLRDEDEGTDVLAKGLPIAEIYPSLEKQRLFKLGDETVDWSTLDKLFSTYQRQRQVKKHSIDPDNETGFGNFSDRFLNLKAPNRVTKNKVHIDVSQSYLSDFYDQVFGKKARAGTNLPEKKAFAYEQFAELSKDVKNRNKNAGGLGPREVAAMLPVLKSFYPDATEVEGYRVSGAKAKWGKENPLQTIKLPTMSEAKMQKYRSAAKKPLHQEISDRPKINLLQDLARKIKADKERYKDPFE